MAYIQYVLAVFLFFSVNAVAIAQGNIVDYFLKNPNAWDDTRKIIHKTPTKVFIPDGLEGLGFNLTELTQGDEVAIVFLETQTFEKMKQKGFCNAGDKLLPGKNRGIGIPSLFVTAEDVKRLAPSFKTDTFDFAAYEPESGYADPVSTPNAFIAASKARGAALMQDCEVTGIRVSGDKVSGVETNKGSFDAPTVVNAGGSFAARIAKMAGVEIPLNTWTHDVIFIRRPSAIKQHPTVIDDSLSMYFRPDTGNLTLMGLEDSNRLGEPPEASVDRGRAGLYGACCGPHLPTHPGHG